MQPASNITKMQAQDSHSHYLHTIEHPHSQRTIVKSFHSFEQGQHIHKIAVVNHNTIEVYHNVGTSITYDRTYHFMCDITVLEVLAVKGERSDVLFLADEMGRFVFWDEHAGVLAGSNLIRSPEFMAPVYQRAPAEEKQPQFSGIYCGFHSMDTEALIFFTTSTKIVIVKARHGKRKITYSECQFQCPYLDINFIGIVCGRDTLLGIISQREEKTFLNLHRPYSQNFECMTSLQKPNLASFYSSPEGEQLVLITNSQLSILSMKNQQVICTYQISEPGLVSLLGPDLYLYVGELGSQMIAFSKMRYKNYGAFLLENQVCMKMATHGRLSDGGYLVSVVDQGHTVEFVGLYEDNWKSVRSVFSTNSIFSIEDLEGDRQCLAVMKVGENIHQVGVLSKRLSTKLHKETVAKTPVLSLFPANNGKALIVSTFQNNSVFLFDPEQQIFETGFDFEPGIIVAVLGKYVVMEQKIYEMDLVTNSIRELWHQKNIIVAADWDGKFIGFQSNDFCYKFYNTQTKQIDRVRKNCTQEYIWKFYCRETLLVGSLDMAGIVKIVPVFKEASTVQTQCRDLITDMLGVDDLLFISFGDCKVHIYEYVTMRPLKVIDCASEPLRLLKSNTHILAYGINQSYLVKPASLQVEQLQFDPSKQTLEVTYLNDSQLFVVSHPQALSSYSLSPSKPEHCSSYRVVSMNIGTPTDPNPPFASVICNRVYVAYCYELIMRNVSTAELLKKQSHGLKEIYAMEKLDLGLMVCGVDDMDTTQIFLFGLDDLQILFAEPLGKKSVSAARCKQGNSFFLREQNTITLYEIKQGLTLKQIFSTKIGLNGYTLGVQPQLCMLLASDPLRYLVVYDYRLNKLVSLCRYQNLNTINDAQFLENSCVVGDSVGTISIAEFNFDKGQIMRTTMTEVGSLKLGSEIIQIRRGKRGLIYSTLSGSIGRLIGIGVKEFTILKQAEKQALAMLESNPHELKYREWVNRMSLEDKLIDGFLIGKYLEHMEMQNEHYEKVEQAWQRLTGIRAKQ